MSASDLEKLFTIARRDHESGRLREAELAYRRILSAHPNQPRVLHMLGLLAVQTGHTDAGESLLNQSAALDPSNLDCLNHLSLVQLSLNKFDQAITGFRNLIARAPDFPDAHNSLGAALKKAGRVDEAIASYRKALALRPDFPEAANNLGVALSERGEIDSAVEAYRAAIRARPSYAEALSNLGNALREHKNFAEAVTVLSQAAAAKPDAPEIFYNLGITLHEDARPDEAIAAYRRALSLRPNFFDAWNNLGNALQDVPDFDAAIDAYRRALSLRPDDPDSHNNLGKALKETGRLEEAVAEYGTAIKLKPDYADAHSNLGNALMELGQLDEAIASYRNAIGLRDDSAGALSDLASALGQLGRRDESHDVLDRALKIDPSSIEAQWNMSLGLLLRGDFEHGWPMYEVRHRIKAHLLDPQFVESFWDGSDLEGQRILLIAEQGLGDSIHFIRYAPLVAARGGRVLLLCQPRLRKLFEGQPGIHQVISMGEMLPAFDVCCPLMSLPNAFKTRADTIPANVPYLAPDPAHAAFWAARLSQERGPRIGLVWAGNPTYRKDRYRSTSLAALAPLATAAPQATFISLQKGPAAAQSQSPPPPMRLLDWTSELDDLVDTAALVSNLDLIISVDTAVAHLAGALARPVWLLVPFAPDWRWQLNRSDSRWYPTMRLFRQTARNDWTSPIHQIADALGKMSLAR